MLLMIEFNNELVFLVLDVSSFEEQVALALLHFTMKEFAQFRFDCNDDVDRLGGESDKSRQIVQ